ncbi:hypothetical protein [Chryseobacterium shandongense]|uniref:hypothetical protein n=1 Tax=Chryseobacterium shandongense TaxID=1493872 RepID=UPI000F4D2D93|nr:hypothetical protein [Chryseobacterium shandongense]AZA58595.1 hypothetical protein EG350_16010 [Chryseobacterium shandongense]
MDKNTQKRTSFNTQIVKVLSSNYNVTEYFVRECIKGNRTSLTADEIKKKYNELNNPTIEKIKEFKNKN